MLFGLLHDRDAMQLQSVLATLALALLFVFHAATKAVQCRVATQSWRRKRQFLCLVAEHRSSKQVVASCVLSLAAPDAVSPHHSAAYFYIALSAYMLVNAVRAHLCTTVPTCSARQIQGQNAILIMHQMRDVQCLVSV